MLLLALPLALTISRFFLGLILGILFMQGPYHLINPIIIIAGITDFLDGYLARKFKAETVIGSTLDPLADKFFIIMLTTGLAYLGLISWIVVFLLLKKDLILGAGFLLTYKRNQIIKPLFISKLATALQILASVMIYNHIFGGLELLYLSIVFSYVSVFLYIKNHVQSA